MERLKRNQPTGLDNAGLRNWGTVFVLLGVVSRVILQNGLLGMATVQGDQLLALFEENPDAMGIAAAALILQALESCAAPIFCFLLVERFRRETDARAYLLTLALAALVTELPYNLAMHGRLLDTTDRNPVFGLVFGLIALYFYSRYSGKGVKNLAIKAMVTLAAIAWCVMLDVQDGQCLVILTAVLWASREKHSIRMLFGVTASVICCLFSVFYALAPMAFLAIHFYNEEREQRVETPMQRFAAYPMLLLLAWAACTLLI